MTTLRWEPRDEITGQEQMLLKRLETTKKLFGFLRRYRRQLFDDSFQQELAATYRQTGAGKEPNPPAQMAMVVLLQAYTKASDADAVQHSVMDLRWQMVLGCLGATEPPFSQGALYDFRERLIEHDLDRRLLERTGELAAQTKAFDRKKLPKSLRLAVDSKPLKGAGRVEDTFNLLGHAARNVVHCIAALTDIGVEEVASDAGIPLVLASSTKLALDTDWTDPKRKSAALQKLLKQLRALLDYVDKQLPQEAAEPPLRDSVQTLEQLLEQDLEPDPNDPKGKRMQLRDGVAKDRRVSVNDRDMRHGRKTRTKAFNGFKQHMAVDLEQRLILACAIVGANRREHQALPALFADLDHCGVAIDEMHVDRGYTTVELNALADSRGFTVFSKPRQMPPNEGRFTKRDFDFNLRNCTVTCPAGQVQPFTPGKQVHFEDDQCRPCSLRPDCTIGNRRALQISDDEIAQQKFVRLAASKVGRQTLRQRAAIEHRLAHLQQKQGDRARYIGERANLFDLRRTAAVLNLEVIHFEIAKAA